MYRILSHFIVSYLTVMYHNTSYHIVSHHIISYCIVRASGEAGTSPLEPLHQLTLDFFLIQDALSKLQDYTVESLPNSVC